ncbi:hypothetical protein V2J09_010685 [Rumex salicifolius]
MEMEGGFSNSAAVIACTAMAFLYVAILYAPTVILRLPSPSSLTQFLIRRFVCVCVSSILCLLVSSLILIPLRDWNMLTLIDVFGVRADHIWQAVIFPLALTSLMYPGSLVLNFLSVFACWRETGISGTLQRYGGWLLSLPCNIMAWRNYVVAPLTEELVFRACMIPLLLCGGFKPQNVIFLSPIFFSLAHLNHLWELYNQRNCSLSRASLAVGIQLMYTVVFGSYASFLYIRTGHLIAPLVAHIFCNFMGLPVLYSQSKGHPLMFLTLFVAGTVGFLWLLFPVTNPDLYNSKTDNCRRQGSDNLHLTAAESKLIVNPTSHL